MTSSGPSPSNSRRPRSSSTEITPAANRSEEEVAPSPRSRSGARYPVFPASVPSFSRSSPAAREIPKSVIFTAPFRATRTFPGETSRCTTPFS